MVRYMAYILVALLALVLTGSVAVVLGQGVVECLAGPTLVHVTAFDGIGAEGGHPPRIRAVFEGPTGPRPLRKHWAVVRFPGGWTQWAYISRSGLIRPRGPAGLRPGPHRFQVGLPETHPRLDAVAHGTVWVRPEATPVLWIDARAVVPDASLALRADDAAAAEPPGGVPAVLDVLKTLAGACRPVYLVADEARPYAVYRRRLKQWGAPPGPCFWVVPGRAYGRLKGLKGVWPTVRGAVVVADDLARAADRVEVTVERVPPAGEAAGPQGAAGAWRRTLHRLTAPPSTNPSHRR
ncbi:MAG: hypothetical protein R6X20_01715 [Phycisphaerae bacterium]